MKRRLSMLKSANEKKTQKIGFNEKKTQKIGFMKLEII